MNNLLQKLDHYYKTKKLSYQDFQYIMTMEDGQALFSYARGLSLKNFSNEIYIRALIEISTYCKNNCLYCGLRRDNKKVTRMRLDEETIFQRAKKARSYGLKTLVLQGGEDDYYNKEKVVSIIKRLKTNFPEMALTLSLGERSFEDYKAFKEAGVDRYLLRHETASPDHYARLHEKDRSLKTRIEALRQLKELSYQVGCGMMIGSAYQKLEDLYQDLLFILDLKPQMVGLGPFIPHRDTPFRDFPQGPLEETLRMLSLVRIGDEKVLLPATTALASIDPEGREKGILAGANVLMPNVGDEDLRKNYQLYDHKIGTEIENKDDFLLLEEKLDKIGYKISFQRGDYPELKGEEDV